MIQRLISTLAVALLCAQAFAQPDLTSQPWPAKWISVPGSPELDYGVYYFRKNVDLAAVPARYLVHVTGDNRYKLYVNEKLVSMGPAKGDALHWNYETVDLAPYLNGGQAAGFPDFRAHGLPPAGGGGIGRTFYG